MSVAKRKLVKGGATTEPATATGNNVTLFSKLTAATGVTPNEGEAYQEFALRLGQAISALSDEAYGKLPQAAQKWFSDATDAVNAGNDAPPLEGFPAAAVTEEKATAKQNGHKEKTVKTTKAKAKVKAKVKAKAKKGNATAGQEKAAKRKERTARSDGVSHKLHALVVKNPDISFEAACDKAGIKAKKYGYAWSRWNEARDVMSLVSAAANKK